jgi:hypothetical protein
MTSPASGLFPEQIPLNVPVLSTVIANSDIPAFVQAALEARALEKAAFLALADELMAALRPEMERLAAELLRKSIHQVWLKRNRLDRESP